MLEINRKTLTNYLIVALLVFGVTSFGLTYYVFPTYAAPNVSTFFSCETSDGCAYRYNTTQYLAPLPNNMTAIGNWSTSSLIYQMLSNETITINGDIINRNDTNSLLELFFTPLTNGSMGLHIVTDLNGQPDAESLEIEVNASSISAGFPTVFSAFIDKGASTGGDIHSFNTLAVGTGTIQVVGLGVFSGIDVIHQHSGSPVNMARALIYDGSFSDVTAAFTATGNDTAIFVSNDDSVYIGHGSQFGEIQFNLDTVASGAGIRPTFEFSTGAGGWTIFSPIDATDGMRDDGAIAYEKNDLTGWATDTVSGFAGNFWIRINRTQAGLGTVPIEDLVQIVVDTDFIWDEDGNVEIFGMNVTDTLGLSSGNGVIILAGGRPVLFTPIYPATNNWNATFNQNNFGGSCNDFSLSNSICPSTFTGVVDGANNAFNNLGAAGNDLGASNTLVATTFSGTVNMNGNSIINVNSLAFDTDTAGNSIIGDRASDLRIITTSDGTNSRGIESYTPLDATAGIGTNILRMNITGGCAQGSCEIKLWEKLVIPTNNTLQVWEDAIRPADSYVVNDHAKVQITGLQLESEYIPNQFEVFNNGDVVCLKDWKTFTKCDLTYNKILGPIHLLPKRGITGYNNVSYLEDEKTKYRLESIWEDISHIPLIIVEGPYTVKVCIPVSEGQLLIAGVGGCVIGVNSYSDIPPLMFPIGYAANDSKGGYVEAVIL